MSNYTLWSLAGPLTWPIWACAVAYTLLIAKRSIAAVRRWLALGLGLFVITAVLPTDYLLLRPLETRFPQPALGEHTVDHIVVLSGAERLEASRHSGKLELNMHGERLLEGAKLARRFPAAKLWAVGGVRRPGDPRTDVDWTAETWRELGIPSAQITKVSGTRDTCGNAQGFAKTQPRGTVVLITSAFHMPRAMACFRAAHLEPVPYPVDYQTRQLTGIADAFGPELFSNAERTDLALHEWLGLLYYRARGRIESVWPAPRTP